MTAILLLSAFLILIPLLLGTGFCKIMKQRICNNGLRMISGLMILMTVFEGLCLFAIKLNLSLHQLSMLFLMTICVLLMLTLFIIRKELSVVTLSVRKSISYGTDKLILTAIVILILICLFVYLPSNASDTISETVRTTLFTNTLYQFNPLTGQSMENGMYPICQVCTTPLFDACVIMLTGTDIDMYLNVVFPAFTILGSLLVMWLWAKMTAKPRIYMIVYTLLVLFSLNKSGTFAYELLHQGHLGNIFVIAVILPFICYLIYMGRKVNSPITSILYVILIMAVLAMNINITSVKHVLLFTDTYTRAITIAVLLIAAVYFLHTERFARKQNILWYILLSIIVLITGFYYPVMAFVLADVLERLEAGMRRNMLLIAVAGFIVLSGSIFLYTQGDARIKTDSDQTEAIEDVINIVEDFKTEQNLESITLAAPREILATVRKKNASILLPYGRDYWNADVNLEIGDIYNDVAYCLYAGLVEMEDTITQESAMDEQTEQLLTRIAGTAKDLNCEILVTTSDLLSLESWCLLTKTDGYSVYIVVK